MSWQAQHFVNLHVHTNMAGTALCEPPCADFVAGTALEVQISWQAQRFVKLHVLNSWQAQDFVNLHVQISWQTQYKMRFREIAHGRSAVFFNRTGGFEPGKSGSAERRL